MNAVDPLGLEGDSGLIDKLRAVGALAQIQLALLRMQLDQSAMVRLEAQLGEAVYEDLVAAPSQEFADRLQAFWEDPTLANAGRLYSAADQASAILAIAMGGVASGRGMNHPATRAAAQIGREAHRQLEAEGAAAWRPEVRIELPNGRVVVKDGVNRTDPGKVRIIKSDTPWGRRAAQERTELMRQYGFDPQVELNDPADPRFRPGSPTYIGPRR